MARAAAALARAQAELEALRVEQLAVGASRLRVHDGAGEEHRDHVRAHEDVAGAGRDRPRRVGVSDLGDDAPGGVGGEGVPEQEQRGERARVPAVVAIVLAAEHEDSVHPRERLVARLDHLGVTFHAKLGTQGERVERIARLAQEIAPLVGADLDLKRPRSTGRKVSL